MKNPELYHKTIGILVKAYLNDTLIHGDCTACAVGNIVAGNLGINLKDYSCNFIECFDPKKYTGLWYNTSRFDPKAIEQASFTGYNIDELWLIEKAFEWASNWDSEEQEEIEIYNGLMAVVEVLGQIHECDKETIQESKLMFVKC